ncbi:hypothetical protein [Rhizobium sp. FKY42]|uniref:hypothetical protein n=1 Tax=Rhizobium sp. FKY42 TaxID=2562310 RepID=UPI0014851F66|nr:hypothetical protein [Rhizobium sp. FKY42]
MTKLARRMTIITLTMVVFAISMSALVNQTRKANAVSDASTFPCRTIGGECGALL